MILASALGHAGQNDRALEAFEACERLRPGFARAWATTDMYEDPADDRYFLEGLRNAGCPLD